jgi:predicted GNAT superfamily acetyltransferase
MESPSPVIRPAVSEDLAQVEGLNEAAVPHVNSVPVATLERFIAEAAYFKVALVTGRVAGFLVAFAPGASYESPNYRWFEARYDDFLYIDRVAVAEHMRGHGIAGCLYGDLERVAVPVARRLACEVNTRPRNAVSLDFHHRRGFESVGSQQTEGGAKTVSLLIKTLPGAG